jgi:hypothetical protein
MKNWTFMMIVRSGTGRISCEETLTQKVTPFLKRNMPHQINNLLYSLWPSVVLCVLCVNDFVFQLRFLASFRESRRFFGRNGHFFEGFWNLIAGIVCAFGCGRWRYLFDVGRCVSLGHNARRGFHQCPNPRTRTPCQGVLRSLDKSVRVLWFVH